MLADPTIRETLSLAQLGEMQRSTGSASLEVKSAHGQTRIRTLFQKGCAKIRMPRVRGICGPQAVLINSSGGMTGGDRLKWCFEAGENTQLTVTTQACERVYRSAGGIAQSDVKITVKQGARLNWLPQETIVFDRGDFARDIEINLEDRAQLLLAESTIFGRRAMRESVKNGSFRDRWRIRHNGNLIHAEDFFIDGDIASAMHDRAVAGGGNAMATVLLVAGDIEGYAEAASQLMADAGSVSVWNGKLLARLVAEDGYTLRKKLVPLIELLNPAAGLPKVWSL